MCNEDVSGEEKKADDLLERMREATKGGGGGMTRDSRSTRETTEISFFRTNLRTPHFFRIMSVKSSF